jgi:Tfp pilus assembly protein PilN
MRAVNLLPGDDRGGRKAPTPPVLVGVLLAVLLTVAFSAAFLSASGKVADRRHTLEDEQATLAALPPVRVVNNTAADTLNAETAARVTAVSGALQRRVSWDRVLRELSMVLPSDVWLTTLTAKAPQSAILTVPAAAPTPGATPTGLVIGGYTYSQDAVARLLSRLQVVPDLTNVQLQSSAVTPLGNSNVVAFTILADIKTGGGSA